MKRTESHNYGAKDSQTSSFLQLSFEVSKATFAILIHLIHFYDVSIFFLFWCIANIALVSVEQIINTIVNCIIVLSHRWYL